MPFFAPSAPSTLGWINVKDFGARGNGTTDDTAAITAAIAALPVVGGVLYFPAGTYVTSGGFTISTPCIVRGEGQWYGELGLGDVASYNLGTTITCTSQTAVLFLVTASAVRFLDLTLSHAATPAPTDGAGIRVNSPSGFSSVCYDSVTVRGFYINWDLQNGYSWMMVNCVSYGSVLYGLRQKNTVNADAGDWTLVGCTFLPGYHSSSTTAALRIESGGGGRVDSCKIVNADDGIQFHNGIEVNATGIATSVLNIGNSSFENIANDAINIASGGGTWYHIVIDNCEAGIVSNNGITMAATTLGDIQHVAISNCSLAVGNWPISLTNIRHVKVNNIVGVDSAVLVEATGCDDLKDSSVPIGAHTSFSAGPVIERTYQVDAATGQTQDLMQWRSVGGASVLAHVDVDGNVGCKTLVPGTLDTMTYATTIALSVGAGEIHKTTTVHATGDATINASAGGVAGQRMTVLIANDATSGKTITFGSNLKPNGTLVGTASKAATVSFISDGTAFYEVARQTGL